MKRIVFLILGLWLCMQPTPYTKGQEILPEQPVRQLLSDSLAEVQAQTKKLVEQIPQKREKVKKVKVPVPVPVIVYIHDTVYLRGNTVVLIKSDSTPCPPEPKKKKSFIKKLLKWK